MSFGYPAGCSQADVDRATQDETREKCRTCEGTGEVESHFVNLNEIGACSNCKGTGYEPVPDTREDNAYEQAREDEDVEF